ncbi:hypothetical protein Tco_0706163 [Tanacetum coccineum]|uniref:Uncharacterized protein n=1 Tax=Tanacetum coccineum TaxID=301880 RepID=A0ABQ4Y7I4_9ASTR
MNPKSKSGSPPSLVLRSRPPKPHTPPTNLPNKTPAEAVLVKGGFRWFLQFDGGQSMTDAMLMGIFKRASLEWQIPSYSEPIVSTASPTLTPFGDSDFLLMEEADSFLALKIEPPPPLPNHGQYMPGGRKELKLCEAKAVESSVNQPPEVELKELPPHLE